MIILILFSFLAGIVTVLSPCILPVLPIILSSSLSGASRRPIGVIIGFIVSFTFFTLFLSILVKSLGISADLLRLFAVIVILFFGISLLHPKTQVVLEKLFSGLARFVPQTSRREGFVGGILVGLSIGLLWTPCVGPILASVISLAITGSVSFDAFFITLAYSLGTAIPMFVIVKSGRSLFIKMPWLATRTQMIQKVFGTLMILTAIAIIFNFDRSFQTYVTTKFPQYGVGLTKIEDDDRVKKALNNMDNSTEERAPEIVAGGEWFNLSPGQKSLSISQLRGKVVMIDFWTYTCINCIRTLPYVQRWYEKYKDKGLVIIGVHTPEFEFEKNPDNVRAAIVDFKLTYPIVQDNDYATWNAYHNNYWPAKYLIDKKGRIRYHHFGEGDYDETEEVIQSLLSEMDQKVVAPVRNPTYIVASKTPELYLGYDRIQFLSSPEAISPDKKMTYSKPKFFTNNTFVFEGDWIIGKEYAMPSRGSKLYLSFEASQAFLVMRNKKGETSRAKVFLNGKAVDKFAGVDVKDGIVIVDKDRLYNLIKLPSAGRHELQLEFLDDGVELFAFTFG